MPNATGAVADEGTCDGDGQMGLPGSGAVDENKIALVGHEAAGGQIAHQAFVDRSAGEVERVDVLGQWQLGDGHLVADRSRPSPAVLGPMANHWLDLGYLGLQQVSHDARRLVLALDAGSHDFVMGAAHPVELEAAHQVQDLGAFHVGWSS